MTAGHATAPALDIDKVAGVARELGERIETGVRDLRREIAHRIDSDPVPPVPRRAGWIAAAVLFTLVAVLGWVVLARRPQRLEPYPAGVADPPSTIPPGDAELDAAERHGALG